MSTTTPTNTAETRDPMGRFTIGNKGGPGNPFARQVAKLRGALVNSVTPEDVQAIAQTLIKLAKDGNVQAAKLVFSYAIGKPEPAPQPDRLDADEWQGYKETAAMKTESGALMNAGTPESHLNRVRVVRPILTDLAEREYAKMFLEPDDVREKREEEEADAMEAFLNSPAPPSPVDAHLPQPPSTNGDDRDAPPSANGRNGEHPPSANGRNGEHPPSANGARPVNKRQRR